MKKLLGLLALTTVVATACGNGDIAPVDSAKYTVEGFKDGSGNLIEFNSFNDFAKYFEQNNFATTSYQKENWQINGFEGVEYGSQFEAINAFKSLIQIENVLVNSATFDANGVSNNAQLNNDFSRIYKKNNGKWTTDLRAAAITYMKDSTNNFKQVYTIDLFGKKLQAETLELLETKFKSEFIKSVSAGQATSLAKTELAQGDYILENGQKYIWQDDKSFGHSTVTNPSNGATITYNGIEYKYLGTSTPYSQIQSSPDTALVTGGLPASATNGKIVDLANDGDIIRIFGRDANNKGTGTNTNQIFASQNLPYTSYNPGIDYRWLDSKKMFVLLDTTPLSESNLDTSDAVYETIDCKVKIGALNNVYPCFKGEDIDKTTGTYIYAARLQESTPTKTVRFTNVDKGAEGFIQSTKTGTNARGWYQNRLGMDMTTRDYSMYKNTNLDKMTMYYEKTNTSYNPSGKLTLEIGEAVENFNRAGFYKEGFTNDRLAVVNTDYLEYVTVYPVDGSTAGNRRLSKTSTDSYTFSNPYWYIGSSQFTRYTSLDVANNVAKVMVEKLSKAEYQVESTTGEIYYGDTLESAAYRFLKYQKVASKIIPSSFLGMGLEAYDYDDITEYNTQNENMAFQIKGINGVYFDTPIAALSWIETHYSDAVTKTIGGYTYSYIGKTSSTQNGLAKIIWDLYSTQKN